jgi:hypothetical protein
MTRKQHYQFDFSFQNSKEFVLYNSKYIRKFGFYKQNFNDISLKPTPKWNLNPITYNDNYNQKYDLKQSLLKQFIHDNNFDYEPTYEEFRNFNPYKPLRTLYDIQNRLARKKILDLEEASRELYGWDGYEWHTYSKDTKSHINNQKHLKESIKENAKNTIINNQLKSEQLQKNLFEKITNKIIKKNKVPNKLDSDIINEFLENHQDETFMIDSEPNDKSWETVAFTTKKPKRSYKKNY